MQRRTFLDAAAALAGLPQVAGTETPAAGAGIEDQSVTDDTTKP
jgi:hypothetical protein